MPVKRPIRVLIAKPGIDGHDKGAKLVARGLRDAGMEVIYTGIRQPVDAILQTAIQESVDVIGLSILSGSHLPICNDLMKKLMMKAIDDKIVLVGGFIPRRDEEKLRELGVAAVFRPNSRIDEIACYIQEKVQGIEDKRHTEK